MIVKKIFVIILISMLFGCQSEYQKLLKSSDYEAQYNAALKYYEQGVYFKTYAILEQILPAYRLTDKAEKINYLIAKCYYEEMDYLMSAYYFERFIMTFPTSEFVEDAYYFSALCYYYNSPKSSLDQEYTKKAIASFQMYINKFPLGTYLKECNSYISELRGKLEQKAFENSKMYFELSDYKAAVVTLKNCIKEYPDSKYREEILFLTFNSAFLLAENSIETKKQERYDMAVNDYNTYIDEYPNGKWAKDAEKLFLQIKKRNIN